MKHLKRIVLFAVCVISAAIISTPVNAEKAEIQSAISAGPESLTKNATISGRTAMCFAKGQTDGLAIQTFQEMAETIHGALTRHGRIFSTR